MVATKTRLRHLLRLNILIEEATFYLASVLVEWLATFNQKRKIEQGKGAAKLSPW
jgi:hypothetical protein